MGPDVCFLVTVVHYETLLRCALRLNRQLVPSDCERFPNEYRELIKSWLPPNVRNAGPIVHVEPLFAVHCHN